MREDDIRIFLSLSFECVDVTEADTEDDVASVTCELVDCLLNLLVILRNVVDDVEILCGIKTDLLHTFGNTVMMSIGIT